MNCRIAFAAISFALAVVASSYQVGVSATQQLEKLTFKMELCGIGAFSSHQIYTVSDGTTLNVDSETYLTLDKARKAFARELKVARRINDRKDLLDETGKRVGERIIVTLRDGRTEWLELEDKSLYKIEGASLRHIEEFRKQ